MEINKSNVIIKYFNTKIVAYVNITLELTSSIYIKYKNYDFVLNYGSRNSIKVSTSQQGIRYTQYTERAQAHYTRSQRRRGGWR